MSEPTLIIASGLVTALGIGVGQNAAHVRAGISAFAESDFVDTRFKRIVAAVLPAADLAPSAPSAGSDPAGVSARTSELIRLAGMAADEALQGSIAITAAAPVPTWCAWPEYETQVPLDLARLARAVQTQTGGRIAVQVHAPENDSPEKSGASQRGRAGGLAALAAARASIAAGAPLALVIAADSLLQQYVLGTLLMQQRIKTERLSDGLIPGMGAAALLLASPAAATRLGLTPLARIAGVGCATEAGHFANEGDWQGDALATAAHTALADDAVPVAGLWSTMTGERCWAGEFGVTQVRCRARVPPTAVVHHPADAWGDLGAASGVALIALAIAAHHRGWAQLPALVLASSDFGGRGAALVVSA